MVNVTGKIEGSDGRPIFLINQPSYDTLVEAMARILQNTLHNQIAEEKESVSDDNS